MRKLALLVLAALVGGSALGAEKGKITIWADDTRAPVFQAVGELYTLATGIPVEVVQISFGDIRGQFTTAAPAGAGPDLIIGAHDWVGELAASGLLAQIRLPPGLAAQFDRVTLEAFTYGVLYGLPYAREGIALVYNTELVATPPKTWDELLALARKLTDPTKPQYGFVVQNPDPYHSFPFLSALGGYIFGMKDGKLDPCDVGLDNAGAIAGAKVLDALFEEGLLPAGLGWDTWTSLFAQGRIGMVVTGPWAIGIARAAGINVGVAPIPTINGGIPKPFVGVQGVMVSAYSPNLALVEDFLFNFFATYSTMLALYKKDPRIPAYLPVYEAVKDDPILRGFAESIANGVPMPNIPQMSAVWGAWYDAMALIGDQTKQPADALREAADKIRATLKCK